MPRASDWQTGGIVDAIESASRNATPMSSNAYDAILNIFDAYDRGMDGVPEFNGGLFAGRIDRNVRFLDRNGDGRYRQPNNNEHIGNEQI